MNSKLCEKWTLNSRNTIPKLDDRPNVLRLIKVQINQAVTWSSIMLPNGDGTLLVN